MIKFFRKLRKRSLTEMKFSKYILYAIGEIFLVVVGILIALQLNNHNENLKIKKFEKEIIQLIDQNIEQDSIALSTLLIKAKLAMSLTDSLIKQVDNKNYSDNLDEWMGTIIMFHRFKSQSSAFEVLKAKGIENISDNNLQLALISYYDNIIFRLYEALKDVEYSFETDWMPVIKSNFSDFKYGNSATPSDPKSFFEDPQNIILFKIFSDNRSGAVNRLEITLNKISEVRKMIKRSQI